MAITGGSAGGWTVLCAAAFHPEVFAAGADYFGVSDLTGFVDATHKFESRYNDWLVGPWPEAADLWRERSPVNFADRIRAPIIILQGLEDAVVPPQQSEVVVAALRANRVPFAYLAFAGRAARLPQGRDACGARSRPSCPSTPRCSASSPPGTSSRSRSSGPERSPGGGREVLQEHAVEVLARLALHDRVIDPRRAVDQVQRRVEALFGEPHLLSDAAVRR